MLQVSHKACPAKRRFLAPPINPLKNQSSDNMVESLDRSPITTDTVVLIVTSQLCLQRRPPILELRRAAYRPEPYIHLLARLAKLLRAGLSTQCRITFAAPTPVMGEA